MGIVETIFTLRFPAVEPAAEIARDRHPFQARIVPIYRRAHFGKSTDTFHALAPIPLPSASGRRGRGMGAGESPPEKLVFRVFRGVPW
jgi:hypothetical protein